MIIKIIIISLNKINNKRSRIEEDKFQDNKIK